MFSKLIRLFTVAILNGMALAATASTLATHDGEGVVLADSCFVHIDSSMYCVAESMPRFTYEVFVGDIVNADYEVSLCYPEFKTLSSKELRALKTLQKAGMAKADAEVDQDENMLIPSPSPACGLDLDTYMTVNRKQGYLNISFSPVVRHEGTWKRILSCQVKVSPKAGAKRAAAKAASTERWTENSVLATGKWAKIRVAKEGIYQLTDADIKKMGFSDMSKVKIYGYGGRLQDETFTFPAVNENVLQNNTPDDLEEVATMATKDGRLLFWAEGTVRFNWNTSTKKYTHVLNHYSSYSYYFVTESDAPRLAVEPQDVSSLGGGIDPTKLTAVTSVPHAVVYDNDTYSWYNGGRRMFDNYEFLNGSSNSYRLATPGINKAANGTKSVDISFGASSTLAATNVKISVNNTSLGNMAVNKHDGSTEDAQVATATFSNVSAMSATEGNTFNFSTIGDSKSRLDYIRVNYPRDLNAKDAPYSFSPQSSSVVKLNVAGADADTHLWMIGQAGCPTVEVNSSVTTDGVLEALAYFGRRRYVCFDGNATYSAPEYVGAVEPQNLHSHAAIDYVIIVPASGKLTAQAERLARLHADKEGMSYSVVRADQIYNEFSSGTPDANAYRRYLKMLYDKAGSNSEAMPKYCLMMGKSPWDSRFVTKEWAGKNIDDYLLAYEVDYSTRSIGSVNSYVTDDFFAMLDDGEGAKIYVEKADVAMGRMVCVTPEEAERLVDKVYTYSSNQYAGIWQNTIAVLGDDGDANEHMNDAEAVCRSIADANPNIDIQKVYWDRYTWTSSTTGYTYPQATARIKQLMSEGALMFDYSGHGSPGIISHRKVLQTADFKTALSPYLSLWVLASCEIYPFDSNDDNLAETSLYVPDGGSIAFVCATRSVFAQQNNQINRSYCQAVLSRNADGELNTMGEALRLAKVALIDNATDKTMNKLKYVFFGDPALKLAMANDNIVLDAINGKPVSEMSGLEVLPAGSIATFSGHVCLEGTKGTSAEVDKNFDGVVSATIYDRMETITCKDNQKTTDGNPMVFSERAKSIFKGSTKAAEGAFSFTVTIPRDISYSDVAGRISFFAISSDKERAYNGFSEKFCLNGTSEQAEPDTKAPEVIAYINSIDNPDYTITDENPVLIADISDDCGINNAGISLGHDIELVLDGAEADYINLNPYFTYEFGSYQKGQLVYTLRGMSRGQHTAQLRVWDVNNNVTVTDVHFIVRSQSANEMSEDGYITATKNPATNETRFITYFPINSEVDGLITYEVYDTRGRCVYKQPVAVPDQSSSATFHWDLCGNDHQPLPAGVYFYRAVIATKNGVHNTDAQKLIIIRE